MVFMGEESVFWFFFLGYGDDVCNVLGLCYCLAGGRMVRVCNGVEL